jgi:hypothetical protein
MEKSEVDVITLRPQDIVKDWKYYLRSVWQFFHKCRYLFAFIILVVLACIYLAENLYYYTRDSQFHYVRINRITGTCQTRWVVPHFISIHPGWKVVPEEEN